MNIPILMYHKIQRSDKSDLNVLPLNFEQQMTWLNAKGFESISLERLANVLLEKAVLPKQPVIITFDDAYQSVWDHAKPVLDKFGMRATMFVVPQAIGKYNFWDENKMVPPTSCMNLTGLQQLSVAGWEIGSHGLSHRDLTGCDEATLQQEVSCGKKALEQLFGETINSFCYPFGAWNEKAEQAVKAAGFLTACAISPGTSSVTENIFALRRIYVKSSDSLSDFKRKISKWYLGYRAWRKR